MRSAQILQPVQPAYDIAAEAHLETRISIPKGRLCNLFLSETWQPDNIDRIPWFKYWEQML